MIDVLSTILWVILSAVVGYAFHLRKRELQRVDKLTEKVSITEQEIIRLQETIKRQDELREEVGKVKELMTNLRIQIGMRNRDG